MKEIDITQWTKVGEGGNGATYINEAEPGVLIKESYLEMAQADALVSEFNLSKAIFELGVPTPSSARKSKERNPLPAFVPTIRTRWTIMPCRWHSLPNSSTPPGRATFPASSPGKSR